MVQDTNFICPRIYNACRLCKIRGNQLNKIDQQISTKIYECTTLKIISTKETKAFICDQCKAKIDEHYQFKMQCIRNVNLQRFNTGAAAVGAAAGVSPGPGPVASGSNTTGGGGVAEANGAALAATAPATATSPSSSAVAEGIPGSSSASTSCSQIN
uniref:ZAD domain-containing protein n=1 Tax=Culex tarsalis TaxID=7177 RepID=A0A1Q3FF54_CULTA